MARLLRFCAGRMQPALVFAAAAAALAIAAPARAEITLSPLRAVVTPDAPQAQFRISNASRRIIEGRLSWLDLAATETGYGPADPALRSRLSAAPYLGLSPASFRLNPGEAVEVTVRLRKQPPDGRERRSHLLIETGAARTPYRRAGALEPDIGLSVSAPVVLRTGRGEAKAKIGATRLLRAPDGLLEIETRIEPSGEHSAYGRLEIAFTANDGDGTETIARLDNFAAWLDAPARKATIPLGARRLPGGLLEIRYEGAAEFEGKNFARRVFEIAPPEKGD